jgi:hypothetical protein
MTMSLREKVEQIARLLRDNRLEEADLDDLVHDTASNPASEINNGGMESQLGYLLRQGVKPSFILNSLDLSGEAHDLKIDEDFQVEDHPFSQEELMILFGIAVKALAKKGLFQKIPPVKEPGEEAVRKVADKLAALMDGEIIVNIGNISAKVYSDDQKAEAYFNAALWFDQASDEEIIELAEIGWGGDQAADDVAYFMEDHNESLSVFFEHDKAAQVGFEVKIHEAEAVMWLEEHRPHLYDDLKRRELI